MCNNAKTEKVAFIAIGLFALARILDDFRSHIAHGPASFIAFAGNCIIHKQRKPEIDDMGLQSCKVNEYILRFQVSVNNSSVMDIFNALQNLSQQSYYNRRLVKLLLLPESHQIFSRKVLDYEDKVVLLLVELFEGVDILTFYQPQNFTLFDDQHFGRAVVFIFFVYYFGRVLDSTRLVSNLLNLDERK